METMQQIISRATEKIKSVPEADLPKIYYKLNCWKWDKRLGEEPEDWGTMPSWQCKRFLWHTSYKIDTKARAKHNIVYPLMQLIDMIYAKKAALKAHFIYMLEMSEEQFENDWNAVNKAIVLKDCGIGKPNMTRFVMP
jgi:hypothetical protein